MNHYCSQLESIKQESCGSPELMTNCEIAAYAHLGGHGASSKVELYWIPRK